MYIWQSWNFDLHPSGHTENCLGQSFLITCLIKIQMLCHASFISVLICFYCMLMKTYYLMSSLVHLRNMAKLDLFHSWWWPETLLRFYSHTVTWSFTVTSPCILLSTGLWLKACSIEDFIVYEYSRAETAHFQTDYIMSQGPWSIDVLCGVVSLWWNTHCDKGHLCCL